MLVSKYDTFKYNKMFAFIIVKRLRIFLVNEKFVVFDDVFFDRLSAIFEKIEKICIKVTCGVKGCSETLNPINVF